MNIEEYSQKATYFYTENIPPLLEKILKNHEVETLLDIGCGDGTLLKALQTKNYLKNKTVFATDLSKNRLQRVKRINKSFICLKRNAENLHNIEDSSIDLLISTQVIEHVQNDLNMIKEVKRILKPKGRAYITTVFKKWYGLYFYRNNGHWRLDPTHVREYTKDKELLNNIKKYNLEIVESQKSLFWFSILDYFFRKLNISQEIFIRGRFLRTLQLIKLPILGYYNWEISIYNP